MQLRPFAVLHRIGRDKGCGPCQCRRWVLPLCTPAKPPYVLRMADMGHYCNCKSMCSSADPQSGGGDYCFHQIRPQHHQSISHSHLAPCRLAAAPDPLHDGAVSSMPPVAAKRLCVGAIHCNPVRHAQPPTRYAWAGRVDATMYVYIVAVRAQLLHACWLACVSEEVAWHQLTWLTVATSPGEAAFHTPWPLRIGEQQASPGVAASGDGHGAAEARREGGRRTQISYVAANKLCCCNLQHQPAADARDEPR